jgi:hypothetical protein
MVCIAMSNTSQGAISDGGSHDLAGLFTHAVEAELLEAVGRPNELIGGRGKSV